RLTQANADHGTFRNGEGFLAGRRFGLLGTASRGVGIVRGSCRRAWRTGTAQHKTERKKRHKIEQTSSFHSIPPQVKRIIEVGNYFSSPATAAPVLSAGSGPACAGLALPFVVFIFSSILLEFSNGRSRLEL